MPVELALDVIQIAGFGAAIVAILAFLIIYGPRFRRNTLGTETISLLKDQNDALRATILDQERHYSAQLSESERRCDEKVAAVRAEQAELRGRLSTLTPEFAAQIAALIKGTV